MIKDKVYPPRRPVIQTYKDHGHGTLSKVLDRKPIKKQRPNIRDWAYINNFMEMMDMITNSVIEMEQVLMDRPNIVYKNIFIY